MKRLTQKQLLKLLVLVLSVVLLTMSLAGCFGNSDPTEPSDDPSAGATQGTEGTEPTEPVVTEPVVTEPQTVMGTVNTDKLNVREKPNSNSPSLEKLAVGTRVEILEQMTLEDVNWGRIEAGWINLKYVDLDTDATGSVNDPDETVPEETTGTDATEPADTTDGTKGTVTAGSLHIRKGPGTKYDSVGKLSKGDTVVVTEKSGNWGKISKGWISLKYVKLEGSVPTTSTPTDTDTGKDTGTKKNTLVTDGSTTALGKVVIDTDALRVRYGPGTDYEIVTNVHEGDTVTYYQKSGNWVRIKDGWISLKYTKSADSSSSTATTGKGTVTADALFIRKGAGTSYDSVGKLYKGDTVEILEVNGNWGRIKDGWICLDYVKMS